VTVCSGEKSTLTKLKRSSVGQVFNLPNKPKLQNSKAG
jgi:hypothetical protein